MADHILVPLNGSPLSEKALEVALAEHPDSEITCLHVIDPADPGYSYYPFDRLMDMDDEPLHGTEEWYEQAQAFADELFESARDRADEHGAEIETELVVGSPGEAIIEYARDHDVDHVVIGSHGRGEDVDNLLGSVTEAVAYRSPVRVTLIR